MAEDDNRKLRGGKILARDPWFGLSRMPDFQAFRRYWHREKKYIGRDILSREEAFERYHEWIRTRGIEPGAKR